MILISGFKVKTDDINEVSELSEIDEGQHDFIDEEFRAACEKLLPDPGSIKPKDLRDVYICMKTELLKDS